MNLWFLLYFVYSIKTIVYKAACCFGRANSSLYTFGSTKLVNYQPNKKDY